MRVANYHRVSSQEQVKHGYSLGEQRHALADYARVQGWEVVAEIADEGDSGADPDRPGLLRILELAESGAIDAAVAVKRDRFFRDLYLRRGFEQDLSEFGVRLIALNDTGSRIGDTVMDALGEEERLAIGERSRSGKLGKARAGKIVGGSSVHLGFRRDATGDHYEVDERGMRVVERLFRVVGAEGKTMMSAARELESEGILSPRGYAKWRTSSIKRIIENDVYLARPAAEVAELVEAPVAGQLEADKSYGVFWFGKTNVRRTYGRSKKLQITKMDSAEHVAIPVPDSGIPPEWVRSAREKISGRTRPTPNASARRAWSLRGRIRCACGYKMLAWGNNKGHLYYVCGEHRRWYSCEHYKYHPAAATEKRVEEFVIGLLRNPDTLREQVKEQAATERRDLERGDRSARYATERLAKLEVMEDGFLDQQAEGVITMDRLREKLAGIAEEKATLEQKVAGLGDRERRLRELEALPGLIEDYLRDLPTLVGDEPVIRDYELTGRGEGEYEAPVPTLLTKDSIHHKSEEELASERREAEDRRAARFGQIFDMLGLSVIGYKDGTLEVRWRLDCRKLLGRIRTSP